MAVAHLLRRDNLMKSMSLLMLSYLKENDKTFLKVAQTREFWVFAALYIDPSETSLRRICSTCLNEECIFQQFFFLISAIFRNCIS